MQYLHIPFRPEQLTALLDRATEPEYGPVIPVTTAMGLRALPFADIEYLECTHHVVHYHLASGEDVASLSCGSLFRGGKAPAGRCPFSAAPPLLCGQPCRRRPALLRGALMRSGARVPIPRGVSPP